MQPQRSPEEQLHDLIERRRRAYAAIFFLGNASEEDCKVVMDDLFAFCRGGETTHHPDRTISDMYAGRREVLQRIMEFGILDFETLFKRYHANPRGKR